MKKSTKILSLFAALVMLISLTVVITSETGKAAQTFDGSDAEVIAQLYEQTPYYVLARQKQLGASHYAYTEALAEDLGRANSDPEGSEAIFNPGSELVLVSIVKNSDGTFTTYEDELISSKKGVIRDPDVSPDGTKILFSWKKSSADDYHLYEMELSSRNITQLTTGSGVADTEPKYLSDGSIVFSSTRDIQTVDCWKTPVSNLYKCNADGSEILRLGYDQVHTTYPTVTSDGRIIYTRWDYNDRTQMWIQSVFQMFEDGTNQTELYGNNSDFPTTLLHTREIPGMNDVYLSIASGHHVYQHGKLVLVDTSVGRNSKDAVSFVFNDGTKKEDGVDAYGQNGRQYKYPYALSSSLYMYAAVSSYNGVDAKYSIYAYDAESGKEVLFVKPNAGMPASQIVPVYTRELFTRPSMVNYASETGTFYVANVYEGEAMEGAAMEGAAPGSVKYLRVVELEFRSSAIGATVASGSGSSDPFSPIATGNGAWDVKKVLGVVPVEADGSALFKAPANKTLYFQLLDENGSVIQTMRSWTTLMPNETFSCVGCHLDKNVAPVSSSNVTLAMKKGVTEIQPDLWMTGEKYADYDPYNDAVGFSYLEEVQPIFDESCIVCHSDTSESYSMTRAKSMNGSDLTAADDIIPLRSVWTFTDSSTDAGSSWAEKDCDTSAWRTAHAPFGDSKAKTHNTVWDSDELWARYKFTGTYYDLNETNLTLYGTAAGKVSIYVNGTLISELDNDKAEEFTINVDDSMKKAFVFGENVIAVHAEADGAHYFDLGLKSTSGAAGVKTMFFELGSDWEYFMMPNTNNAPEGWTTGEDNSKRWKTGTAPFGDRNIDGINYTTSWTGNLNAIFLRKTFTIDNLEQFKNSPLMMNITFDDTIKMYLNGRLVFSNNQWVDTYVEEQLTGDAARFLKEGENVIAMSLLNTAGGRQIDLSLYSYAVEEENVITPLDDSVGKAQFSLEGVNVIGTRQKKYWPLSYLVLTSSKPSGTNWVAKDNGTYVNFLSSMSQAEVVTPNTFGSNRSLLIEKLRAGHGSLTDSEIRTIECWIDLVIPCYGSYDENVKWNNNERREFEEKENKREYYDNLNKAVIDKKAGKLSGEIKIELLQQNGKTEAETTGEGYAQLAYPETYHSGQTIRITLPEGEKYLAVCVSSKLGEEIVYVPDGVFEYKFPSNMGSIYPSSLNDKLDTVYISNIISARIPTKEEISQTRNLAQNAYDLKNASGVYPHASTNSVADNQAAQYEARCAIDGFTANLSHGTWPVQSWGPMNTTMNKNYITVDFGREVKLDTLEIIIRADFPHDTWFTGAVVTFSDGSTMNIDMAKTAEAQSYELGGKVTSSVTLSGFTTAGNEWAAITELRAFGTEISAEPEA